VYAPNGIDPLYDAIVYVPNGPMGAPTYGVNQFSPNVQCGNGCGGPGAEIYGSPLVTTISNFNGAFTLSNVPNGTNIPLVIQSGRWRRKITIPTVTACTNTPLSFALTRMPRTQAENDPADNIPLMAFSTGATDSLECVLRKIGIADNQFSDPTTQGGTGRVRFYLGEGAPGAGYSANTPPATQLWGSAGEIDQYDLVYFPCQGNSYDKTLAQQQLVNNYANAGGRVFATHYSYVWMINPVGGVNPWSSTAVWQPNQASPTPDPQTGFIDVANPRANVLAQWLQIVNASTTFGQISLSTLKHDFNNVVAPSQLWLTLGGATIPPGTVPMQYTFDTPLGGSPAQQCGRVLFNDYHVENTTTGPATHFPAECNTTAMTPQEKLLEFMIFELGN
jgi:hypothetical protein